MKKLKAFTLNEMLIAMVIMSLVIGAAFASLNVFGDVFREGSMVFNETQKTTYGLQRLNRDIFFSPSIIHKQDGFVVGEITYDFMDKRLIRRQGQNIDTVLVISELITHKYPANDSLITTITIEVDMGNTHKTFGFNKEYDSYFKMEALQHGGN